MKNSPLTSVLLGVLLISALASIVLCWLYNSNTRELRSLQFTVNRIVNERNMAQALVGDAVEYSKRNPQLVPVLESVGVKISTNPPAANKPAK